MSALFSTVKFDDLFDGIFDRSISEIIGTDFTHNQASVNVTESDTHFNILVAAPGLKKESFNLHVEKNTLTISASDSKEEETTSDDGDDKLKFRRREFNFASFKRNILLPDNLDLSQIEAEYKQGILDISIAKLVPAEASGPRTIEIK